MSDYLDEFTPDWPYGHVIVTRSGSTRPFVVKVTNWPGKFPIWGHIVGDEGSWCFRADGGSDSGYRLRNAAPPKRVPREIWVNVYQSGYGYVHTSRAAADEQVFGHDVRNTRIKCIHFREVIEESATEPDEEKLPERFNLTETKLALHDHMLVEYAFTWSSTPQGSEFWGSYSANTLSSEDTARAREALRRWIAIAERRAAK